TTDEASKRIKEFGFNELKEARRKTLFGRLCQYFVVFLTSSFLFFNFTHFY
ncbi:unnamed protein product, partial [marine sediment metagenome]